MAEIHPVGLPAGDEQILLEAGSDPSLLQVQGEGASIELLTEFLRCLMSEEYMAARLLCRKVLALEPSNTTAQEFLPVIDERIKLDEELETESSSTSSNEDNNDDESSSESEESSTEDINHCHCNHGNNNTS